MRIIEVYGFQFTLETIPGGKTAAADAVADHVAEWLQHQPFDRVAALWAIDQHLGSVFDRVPDASRAYAAYLSADRRARRKVLAGWASLDKWEGGAMLCAHPRTRG